MTENYWWPDVNTPEGRKSALHLVQLGAFLLTIMNVLRAGMVLWKGGTGGFLLGVVVTLAALSVLLAISVRSSKTRLVSTILMVWGIAEFVLRMANNQPMGAILCGVVVLGAIAGLRVARIAVQP